MRATGAACIGEPATIEAKEVIAVSAVCKKAIWAWAIAF